MPALSRFIHPVGRWERVRERERRERLRHGGSGMNEGPINYGFGACLQIARQLSSPKVQLSSGTTSHPSGAKRPHVAPAARQNNGPIKTSKLTTTRIPLGGEGDGNIQFHPLVSISYHRDGERTGLENRRGGDSNGVTPRGGSDAGTDLGPTPRDTGTAGPAPLWAPLGMRECFC